MKQFDFIDLAAQGGFELIETTSERSGYPLDLKKAIIGFDSMEEAREYAEQHDLSIEIFHKRDGWNVWYRTGTTMQAAIVCGRNSCGYEIDANFEQIIREGINNLDIGLCNNSIKKRFDTHIEFITARENAGKIVKHFDNTLHCKVMTKQESEIELNYLTAITCNNGTGVYTVEYNPHSDLSVLPNNKHQFSSVQ